MNKALKKYGKVSFKSIVSNRQKLKYLERIIRQSISNQIINHESQVATIIISLDDFEKLIDC